MSLEELIGSRLAISLPGTEATDEVLAHVCRIQPKSVVLFSRNFTSLEQLARLIHSLEDALGWRLLVMVDHEGGRINRFGTSVTQFPDAMTIARQGDPEAAARQGAVEARELKGVGIQANLAPCVDVIVEGSDPIIGDRSYGSDPTVVSQFAVARIQGLQSHGVAACAKHFPGLGAVPRDPHKTLSDITLDRETMERVHLAPFRAAIDAGVAMVMSSHVRYVAFGDPPGQPATFSPAIIHSLLRTTLRFPGLILSDDLEMGAIGSGWSMGEAAVRAAQAGHDVLLICSGDFRVQEEALSALRRAYQAGPLDEGELQASVRRLEAVREKFLS